MSLPGTVAPCTYGTLGECSPCALCASLALLAAGLDWAFSRQQQCKSYWQGMFVTLKCHPAVPNHQRCKGRFIPYLFPLEDGLAMPDKVLIHQPGMLWLQISLCLRGLPPAAATGKTTRTRTSQAERGPKLIRREGTCGTTLWGHSSKALRTHAGKLRADSRKAQCSSYGLVSGTGEGNQGQCLHAEHGLQGTLVQHGRCSYSANTALHLALPCSAAQQDMAYSPERRTPTPTADLRRERTGASSISMTGPARDLGAVALGYTAALLLLVH